ncbi:MAG: FCD domain-containing protein [Psychromonas sp.]
MLFHQTVYLSTGNQFHLPFANILSTIFKQFIAVSALGERFCIEEHRVIYDAIMSGDADMARLKAES